MKTLLTAILISCLTLLIWSFYVMVYDAKTNHLEHYKIYEKTKQISFVRCDQCAIEISETILSKKN